MLTNVLRAIDGTQKENSKQRDSHVGGSNRNKAYRMGSKRDKEHKTGCVQRAHGCVEKEHVCMRRLGMAKGGRGYSSLNRVWISRVGTGTNRVFHPPPHTGPPYTNENSKGSQRRMSLK